MKIQLYKITDLKDKALAKAIESIRKELDNEPNKTIKLAHAGYETNDKIIIEYSNFTLALFDKDGRLIDNADSDFVDSNFVWNNEG